MRILPNGEPSGPAHGRPRRRGTARGAPLCLGFPESRVLGYGVFVIAMATDQIDGWLARRRGVSSPLGKLLDPVADKVLVLAALVMLIGEGVAPAWMVALIVVREILVSGLRLAAVERGVVLGARDLGRVKTWAQAIAATIAGSQRESMERRRGLVGALRRPDRDVGLRARLRPRRAARSPRRERVGRSSRHAFDRLARGGASPCARVRSRSLLELDSARASAIDIAASASRSRGGRCEARHDVTRTEGAERLSP